MSSPSQAAKDELSKASAKLQRAMEEMQAAQERFGDAKAKVTDIKDPGPSNMEMFHGKSIGKSWYSNTF